MKAMKLVPALSLLIPALAYAQPEAQDTGGFDHAVAPVSNAFEIGVSAGQLSGQAGRA